MANHRLDAEDARTILSEVNDNLAMQTRMLATVIAELDADADKILSLKSPDNRLVFSAGMLKNRLRTDLEATIQQIAAINQTVKNYRRRL